MLHEFVTAEGLVILKSSLLRDTDFNHGFSTRIGGVSLPPFASLNLQSSRANADLDSAARDAESNLEENRRRFARACGVDASLRIAEVSQVHGCEVTTSRAALASRQFADAITSAPGEAAALIRIADCVPILIACRATGIVVAIHAGWRGVVAGVVTRGIDAIVARGAIRDSLLAAVGPCIRAEKFEVGAEVAEAMAEVALGECITAPSKSNGKMHADLVRAVSIQLERASLSASRIDADPPCTHADAERFFSYRRDGLCSGRLAAIIAPRH